MEHLRNEIIACFEKYPRQDALLIDELERKIAEKDKGSRVYSLIFDVLSHLRIEPERAERLWYSILDHRKKMMSDLGREVGLRTAFCDYLYSISKTLENPMVVELKVFEKHYQSNYIDDLTGLYSRRSLAMTFEREIARALRHNSRLSLLFFDIDDFKNVNDTYGHIAGDECLVKVSSIIMREIRADDIAIRYGGEEILVILPQTDKMQAYIIAERIRREIEFSVFDFGIYGKGHRVTVSGGISSFPDNGDDMATLVRYADMAMYEAKSSGKNRISIKSRDQRQKTRIDYSETVEVGLSGDDDSQPLCSVCGKNLSCTGILLSMPYPVEIGSEVYMQLPLNGRGAVMDGAFLHKGNILALRGSVVRNDTAEDISSNFDVGVSFIEMDNSALNYMADYVNSVIFNTERKK